MRDDAGPPPTPQRQLCVSLHDVAPATWAGCCRVLAAIQQVAVLPVTLLVVPAYRGERSANDRVFVRAMDDCLADGHELALHGYFHEDRGVPDTAIEWFLRRVYTAGEGEFRSLDERDAAERIRLGKAWFRSNGWPLEGFVAPAWLLNGAAWRAIRAGGFRYTATLHHLHLLQEGRVLPAPCVTYSTRAAWRRLGSRCNAAAMRRLFDDAPLVRLALHPRDADFPAVRRSWQAVLAAWLRERKPVTKATVAGAVTVAPDRSIQRLPAPEPEASPLFARASGQRGLDGS